MQIRYLALLPMLATAALLSPLTRAQVPVFAITPVESTIKFNVKASVPIAGNFDKWDATLTFASTECHHCGFGYKDSGSLGKYR
jgi:hypothetical protein